MNEQQTVRPTKKQRETLVFIEKFIAENGYSPSYREIMNGCNYTSVATVALHVRNLIARGHLRKRDHSARSLEIVNATQAEKVTSNEVTPAQEKWLVEKIEHFVREAEAASSVEQQSLDEIQILLGALRVLGLEPAAQSFTMRVAALKQRS
jgi:SOS-response transcriptional repressor LexA